MLINRIAVLLTFLLLLAANALAAVPPQISFQGRLTDAGGNPLPANSVVSVRFALYPTLFGGVAIWSETQNTLVGSNGQFIALLGSINSLDESHFLGAERFLGIKVGSDPEMSPRQRLVTAPYAYRPATIDGATGGQITSSVGIGIAFPDQLLHVHKGSAGSVDAVGSSIAVFENSASGYLSILTPFSSERGIIFGDNLNNLDGGVVYVGSADRLELRTNGNATRMSLDANGNVGVGTNSPTARLHVSGGDLCVGNVPSPTSVSQNLYVENSGGDAKNSFRIDGFANDMYVVARSETGSTSGAGIVFRTAGIGAGEADRMRITSAGQVGIGTNVPEQSLHVHKASAGTVTADINSIAVFENNTNGYLSVLAPSGVDRGIIFGDELNNVDGGVIYVGSDNRLELRTNNNATRLTVSKNGQVGIGTVTPTYELDVIGAIRCNNKILTPEIQCTNGAYVNGVTRTGTLEITGGSDLAEPFDVGGKMIEAGSVVVIDDEHPGQLKLSERAYDSRVAGVVSGAGGINPGLTLKQCGLLDSGANVALSGRVYVRATAANGAIKPGDLLTTSDQAGLAMKATDHERAYGAVLGKAMSGLEQGEGLVLLLVNLH